MQPTGSQGIFSSFSAVPPSLSLIQIVYSGIPAAAISSYFLAAAWRRLFASEGGGDEGGFLKPLERDSPDCIAGQTRTGARTLGALSLW